MISPNAFLIEDGVLKKYIGNDSDVYIPKGVVSIEANAFRECTTIEKIVVPSSVLCIGWGAFDHCENLNEVVFSHGLTTIGGYAFFYCTKLENLILPQSVTNIGEGAFANCKSLRNINIPSSVKRLEEHTFDRCNSLTNFIIPYGVIQIDADAFWGCQKLKSIVISDSVVQISEFAFYGCKKLESIVVSKENTRYHSNNNCIIETTTKTLVIGCKTSVIPTENSVTKIGYGAFCRVPVEEIEIPSSVKEIDNYAFCESNIKKIFIPRSVLKIGEGAFKGCTVLESIITEKDNPVYYSENHCIIDKRRKTLISGCNNSCIPQNGTVRIIEDNAFFGCNFESILVPKSVIKIGRDSFYRIGKPIVIKSYKNSYAEKYAEENGIPFEAIEE